MFERVVENWLTRVNERQYQFPFCQLLISQGFRVLHLSFHGPQEQGKDIIAIDPSGRPIAYQLKTGTIDLASLRKIHGELVELVELPIQFPGVPEDQPHRPVLVTNGALTDTARTAILGYNKKWLQRGLPELEVVLYQDLVKYFVELHGNFLPTQLKDIEKLLRLYTLNGIAPLPRKEFAEFIFNNMPIGELPKRLTTRPPRRKAKRVVPNAKDIGRHLASTALLTSYAVTAFHSKGNHWAVFEAWIIFSCHVLAVAEKYDLREDVWKNTFDLAYTAARAELADLI